MNVVYPRDFNMAITENGETLVRVSEINEMIRRGVFALNREKMNDYHLTLGLYIIKKNLHGTRHLIYICVYYINSR